MSNLKRTNNFVAPLPKPRWEIVEAGEPMPMLPTAQTTVAMHTTYTDRSFAYTVSRAPTWPSYRSCDRRGRFFIGG